MLKLSVTLVLFSSLAACQSTNKQAPPSALAKKIAEVEAKEPKWKTPGPGLAAEAKEQGFTADAAKVLDKALQSDLPTAGLDLQKMAREAQKAPTPKQKEWLETQVAALTPNALAILKEAFDDAISTLDVRAALISAAVAERIQKGAVLGPDRFKEIQAKVLAGAASRTYWRVTEVSAINVGDSYSESSAGGNHFVSAKPGTHLLRVRAKVQNVSRGKDVPYTLGIFEGLKGVVAGLVPETTINGVTLKGEQRLAKPHRWLDDSLIFLADSAGSLTKCGFVTQESGLAGAGTMSIGGLGKITAPQLVLTDEDITFDGIFPVPNGNQDLKLLVLGAAPIPVREAPAAKPK